LFAKVSRSTRRERAGFGAAGGVSSVAPATEQLPSARPRATLRGEPRSASFLVVTLLGSRLQVFRPQGDEGGGTMHERRLGDPVMESSGLLSGGPEARARTRPSSAPGGPAARRRNPHAVCRVSRSRSEAE
jgi:hypothetical protein